MFKNNIEIIRNAENAARFPRALTLSLNSLAGEWWQDMLEHLLSPFFTLFFFYFRAFWRIKEPQEHNRLQINKELLDNSVKFCKNLILSVHCLSCLIAKCLIQPVCFICFRNREGGFTLETVAARCDITPLELQTLLALWIVIYCCFILHQMNSCVLPAARPR